MVDKVALAKAGLKFAAGSKKSSKKGNKGGKDDKPKTPKPGDNPFYYVDVVHDKHGRPKLDVRGRPVTKERRKDREYYVQKLGIPAEDAEILLKMKSRAMLMDGGRKVMGMRTPLGLSTVLTFCVPEIGDGIDGLISYLMVVRAGKISGGLGARNHAAMTFNVGRDFAIGAIPFAGAIIDMFYRANTRNSNMLEKILIERAKKAYLHPDSYESSLHDSDIDSPTVHIDETPPTRRSTKRSDNDRADMRSFEAPATRRTDTHRSQTKQRGTTSNRRFDDFATDEVPVTKRTNTFGLKQGSKSSHVQTQGAYPEAVHSRDDETGRDAALRSRKYVSAKDL